MADLPLRAGVLIVAAARFGNAFAEFTIVVANFTLTAGVFIVAKRSASADAVPTAKIALTRILILLVAGSALDQRRLTNTLVTDLSLRAVVIACAGV